MQDFIQNNPTMFIALVCAVVMVIAVIRAAAAIAGRKKKKEALANEDAAAIVFDEPIFPASRTLTNRGLSGYKIISVNNAEPRIVGGDLLVPCGKAVIDLQYMISGDSLGSRHTNVFEQKRVSLDIEKGKKYALDFNVMTSEFECKIK